MAPQVYDSLPPPHRIFPIEHARYEIKPGLRRFDRHIFQFDDLFPIYLANKQSARAERLSKYFATHNLTPQVQRTINTFILRHLPREHPSLFSFDGQTLHCNLTSDVLHFSPTGDFLSAESSAPPLFTTGLDALATQVQEDLAITSTDAHRHWLSALHLCSPNHWSAEDKIGKSFAAIHSPVAGIEPINRRESHWIRTMIHATTGLTRFAWGIATDTQLNHHPTHPPGRNFDPAHPAAYLRIERQTIWGFPQVGASLFTIRTSFIDCEEIRSNPIERHQLLSMSPASLRYKGIEHFKDDLIDWLSPWTAPPENPRGAGG